MPNADPMALWFLFAFAVFVPYVAIKSARRLRQGAPAPPRRRIFVNVLVMQGFFLGVALFAASQRDLGLFRAGTINAESFALAAGILAAGTLSLPLRWRLTPEAQKTRLALTRPERADDLWLWGAVSLAAGIVEEIVYRGAMVALVLPMIGNWWAAVGVSIAAFTLGHVQQGGQRMVFIALVALGCHLLVRLSGALYLAMAVPVLYDFSAGLFHVRIAQAAAVPAGGQS
jgi:membrane protease YdiL (CAAX protease family)